MSKAKTVALFAASMIGAGGISIGEHVFAQTSEASPSSIATSSHERGVDERGEGQQSFVVNPDEDHAYPSLQKENGDTSDALETEEDDTREDDRIDGREASGDI